MKTFTSIMREIKFRGRCLESGTWIYGSLFNSIWRKSTDGSRVCYIFPDNMLDGDDYATSGDSWEDFAEIAEQYEVDPTTVGQYTGLKDKNGKEIYEGDICAVEKNTPTVGKYFQTDDAFNSAKHNGICYFIDGSFRLRSQFLNRRNETRYREHSFKECEVIGNIHDNPELLKTE